MPFCGEEKYMYPLSLRVGDRGGPNLQPLIPSLCTVTPSFQDKNHCCVFPPVSRFLPLRNLTSRSLLLRLRYPSLPGYQIVRKRKYYFTLTPKKNIYALFKERALLKVFYKQFMIIFLIRHKRIARLAHEFRQAAH